MARQSKKYNVTFGALSIAGDGRARIGIKLDRDEMSIEEAEEYLCGRRLYGKIILAKDADQSTLVGDLWPEVDAAFDVSRFSVTPSNIGASLLFLLEDAALQTIVAFAKQAGLLQVSRVIDIPDEDPVAGTVGGGGEEGEVEDQEQPIAG